MRGALGTWWGGLCGSGGGGLVGVSIIFVKSANRLVPSVTSHVVVDLDLVYHQVLTPRDSLLIIERGISMNDVPCQGSLIQFLSSSFPQWQAWPGEWACGTLIL